MGGWGDGETLPDAEMGRTTNNKQPTTLTLSPIFRYTLEWLML